MKQDNNSKTSKNSNVQQARGPELRDKMEQSQKKGEQFRTENQGRDAMKSPNSSNSEKSHQK
jgi:hypothetical protein